MIPNLLFISFVLLICGGMTSLATFLNRNMGETATQIENYVRDTLTKRDKTAWNVELLNGNELEVLKFLAGYLDVDLEQLRPIDSFRFIFQGNRIPTKKNKIMPGFFDELYYKIQQRFDLTTAYSEGIDYVHDEDDMFANLLEMDLEEFIKTFGKYYNA